MVTPLSSKTSKQALINCFENIYSNHFTTFIYIKRKEKRNPNIYISANQKHARCRLLVGKKRNEEAFTFRNQKGIWWFACRGEKEKGERQPKSKWLEICSTRRLNSKLSKQDKLSKHALAPPPHFNQHHYTHQPPLNHNNLN